MDLGAGTVMFPNLKTITRKIRLRFNKDWKWPSPNMRHIVIYLDGNPIFLSKGHDLMRYKGARERAKRLIVTALQTRWKHLNIESHLAKMEIGFMYGQTQEWDDEVVMKPILSLV